MNTTGVQSIWKKSHPQFLLRYDSPLDLFAATLGLPDSHALKVPQSPFVQTKGSAGRQQLNSLRIKGQRVFQSYLQAFRESCTKLPLVWKLPVWTVTAPLVMVSKAGSFYGQAVWILPTKYAKRNARKIPFSESEIFFYFSHAWIPSIETHCFGWTINLSQGSTLYGHCHE